MPPAVCVYVCRKCRGAPRLTELLATETDAHVRAVGCQKICADHVVGVRTRDELIWFAEIDTAKRRRALVRLIAADAPVAVPERLRRLVVRKRGGRLRP